MEDFKPLKKDYVKAYFCGLTVNNYMHIGHARCYIFWDVVKKWLEYLGYKTKTVSNITDISIDDKILKKVKELGIPFQEYIEKYTVAYFEDREKLGISRNDVHPSAMQHIQEMIELIEKIIEKGYGYKTEDGVYYKISKFKDYGKLSGIEKEKLKAGASGRIMSDEYEKEDVADFCLWKAAKKDEPYWYSPWGIGRPGWHIECSAMAMKYLGESFDIHGGGEDNIFPHHENEIAQSEAVTGKEFSRYWMHVKHVLVNGQKMSKSLGNFITVRDALKKYPGILIRFFMLNTHYRKQLDFNEKDILSVKEKLEKIIHVIFDLKRNIEDANEGKNAENLLKIFELQKKKFEDAMNDDFNTSLAINEVLELIKEINKFYEENKRMDKKSAQVLFDFFEKFSKIFFGELYEKEINKKYEEMKDIVNFLIIQRDNYRKIKDFKNSDAIRENLKKVGILLEDGKFETKWYMVI
ncbi:MAG: cysteine--tRNA ligase [Candidatus Aenigmarchaeota archaeon]|nr:cysteine--tRNA ligase [Candidatus Aenigmarchaeota archaeon]